jgi:hypothetical protein
MDDKDRTPEEKPERRVPRRDRDPEHGEMSVVGSDGKPLQFHDEVEPIDMWDDILDDGREPEKHRTVEDAVDATNREQSWKEEEGEDDA